MDFFWLCFGLVSQFLFFARFFLQWLASEKAGKSVVPDSFWWISLAGSAGCLVYSFYIFDIPFIFGNSLCLIFYIRNIYLLKNQRGKK